ncbi:MAG: hypothetical protein IKY10_04480, partial [Clostridia bacterium]|nr:hypothetical protein [Clostridia bacterium]
MALKAYINGSMKKITRHQMTTFVGGVKKKIPKGVTFINGEKVVLWQIGALEVNTWLLSTLQYPNTTNIDTRFYALETDENKIVYNVEKNICRANVSNVSSPSHENSVEYGGVTYRQQTSSATNTLYDSNLLSTTTTRIGNQSYWTLTQVCNEIDVDRSNMSVTASQTSTSQKTGSGGVVVGKGYHEGSINVGGSYGICEINCGSGSYIIYKNYSLSSPTTVASIAATGYSTSNKPHLWAYNVY